MTFICTCFELSYGHVGQAKQQRYLMKEVLGRGNPARVGKPRRHRCPGRHAGRGCHLCRREHIAGCRGDSEFAIFDGTCTPQPACRRKLVCIPAATQGPPQVLPRSMQTPPVPDTCACARPPRSNCTCAHPSTEAFPRLHRWPRYRTCGNPPRTPTPSLPRYPGLSPPLA